VSLPAKPLNVGRTDRRRLDQLRRNPDTAPRVSLRAAIVLGAADGKPNSQLAEELRTSRRTVIHTRRRFEENGISGLRDMPRCGRPKKRATAVQVTAIKAAEMQLTPTGERWTARALAQAHGLSQGAVRQIWKSCAPQLHSREKLRFTIVRNLVGGYVDSPEAVAVFTADSKQPPDETNRARALPGRVSQGTLRHDLETYLRLGLDCLECDSVATHKQDTRLRAFSYFLNFLDRRISKRWDVHLIATNTEICRHPQVQEWLSAHLRFHVQHPRRGSHWSSLVAVWLSKIPGQTLSLRATRNTYELFGLIKVRVDARLYEYPFLWVASMPFAYRVGCESERPIFQSMISTIREIERHSARTAFRKRPRWPEWSIWD
jgi:transposase